MRILGAFLQEPVVGDGSVAVCDEAGVPGVDPPTFGPAAAHITGGGFVENIPRVLPKTTVAEIETLPNDIAQHAIVLAALVHG